MSCFSIFQLNCICCIRYTDLPQTSMQTCLNKECSTLTQNTVRAEAISTWNLLERCEFLTYNGISGQYLAILYHTTWVPKVWALSVTVPCPAPLTSCPAPCFNILEFAVFPATRPHYFHSKPFIWSHVLCRAGMSEAFFMLLGHWRRQGPEGGVASCGVVFYLGHDGGVDLIAQHLTVLKYKHRPILIILLYHSIPCNYLGGGNLFALTHQFSFSSESTISETKYLVPTATICFP